MFYLKLFGKSLLRKPVCAISFILFYGLSLTFLYNQTNFQKVLTQDKVQKVSFKAFYLNHGVKEKMLRLMVRYQGDVSFEEIGAGINEKEVKSSLESLGVDLAKMGGFRVVFDSKLSRQDMINFYSDFSDSFFSTEVSVSELYFPIKKNLGEGFFKNKQGLLQLLLIVLSFIALSSFYVLLLDLSKLSFVTEKYQRKRNVFEKASLAGVLILFCLISVFNGVFFNISLESILILGFSLVLITLGFSFNLRHKKTYETIS